MANREVLRQSVNQRRKANVTKAHLFEYGDKALQEQANEFDRAHIDELHENALEDNEEGSEFQQTAHERMKYAEVFDGTQEMLTKEEQEKAAGDFNTLVDDMLLLDAGDATTHHGLTAEGAHRSSVLYSTAQRDGSSITIAVDSRSSDDNHTSLRGLTVQHVDSKGHGGQLHRYFVDEEGVARRFDNDASTTQEERVDIVRSAKMKELVRESDPIGASIQDHEEAKELQENISLEREFGLNEQPVSPEEVVKLRLLLKDAYVQKSV